MKATGPTIRVVGRYALYQAIASGGMATVFVGRLLGPVGFARTVAIKRLHPEFASDPEFVAMFLDEARLAARIRHPNVVPTLDVVATKGELFLVMEYVHGESLSKLIRSAAHKEQPIPVPIVVAILSGVLQGLSAAHTAKSERGLALQIVHRDVSPQNILLGHDGQARLLDFGVARAAERLHATQAGQIKGKLAYMPPEQLRGQDVGPATDVYAAAAVLWEALVGHRLFRAENDTLLVGVVLEGKIRRPSEALVAAGDEARARAVAPLDAVIMRALALTKEDRWQTARDLSRALESALPPATTAQVSDWVESVAGPMLSERATILAEIESGSSTIGLTAGEIGKAVAATADPSDPKEVGSLEVPTDTVRDAQVGFGQTQKSVPSPLARQRPTMPVVTMPLPRTLQSVPSPVADLPMHPVVDSEPIPSPPRRSLLAPLLAGGVFIVLLVGLVSVGAVLARPSPAPPPSPAPSGALAAPHDPLHPHATPGCDPPFTYDKDGVKHYKPGCF